MKPYYENEHGKLYHGDCFEVMGMLPDNSIDMVLTSPPYDKIRSYSGSLCWDDKIWLNIIKELFRVVKIGGVVVWVTADSTINGSESGTSFKQALCFKEIGFNLHDTMIYYRWAGPLTHNRYEQEFEYMFVFSKGKPLIFNPIRVKCEYFGLESDRSGQKTSKHNENKKIRSYINRTNIKQNRIKGNVWRIKTASQSGENYKHPAPFPEILAEDHITSWSNVGGIILDPFSGSGTTGKAACKLNRRFVLIEKVEEYCKISAKRIEQESRQMKLF